MSDRIFAERNGRDIPLEDKIFGINAKAKAMAAEKGKDAVINGTIGSLLMDDGNLAILSSVVDEIKELQAIDFADYAPIGGTPEYKKMIQKAAFGNFVPSCFTEAVATPGGTGALRNAISNYSKPGDKVLTADWHWAPYGTIAQEIGRSITTYNLFDQNGEFNCGDFGAKVHALTETQGSLVILLNTPAHNPTGYSLTKSDWETALSKMTAEAKGGHKITLVVDAAYIDYAKDPGTCREFLPLLDGLHENVLVIIAYSLSKTFTLYGMRAGAMICMTGNKEIAEEFKLVCEYSSRGTWSNCNRAAMAVLTRVYGDTALLAKVDQEREGYREMLSRRGEAFGRAAEEAGLPIVPYDSGFFASIPCENAEKVSEVLQKQGIFLVPLKKGLRVSVASISEECCKIVPKSVATAINSCK